MEHADLIRTLLAASDHAEYVVESFDTVAGGEERLCGAGVDIVLLDLELPDCAGIETFYRIYSSAPELPIVVLSGRTDEGLALETVQCGAQDYLVKGRVDRFWLERSIEYAIERKQTQVELRRARDHLEERVLERTQALEEANRRLEQEIGERRRAEAALRESNRQLEEALQRLRETQDTVIQRERLHALGRMASGIAHDFNNALSPILGFSDLLLLKPHILSDIERSTNYLRLIRMAAQDGAKVVSRLREFYRSRSDDEPFRPIVLEDLVREVISLTEPRWRGQSLASGITIRVETDFDPAPRVMGHEAEIREMLTNLVFNSVDAITRNGTLTFRIRNRRKFVALEVADTGSGMSEAVRLRCMEPFYSTKKERGTGLGLGIVYGIVTRHDGRIEIESTLGKGTTVRIAFPVGGREIETEETTILQSTEETVKVLVVEDEPLVREVLEVYLSSDGHEVVLAENGVDGLEKFEAGQFGLVLTDRAMPEMNGDQLALAIKERSPQTPVVLLTGFGDLMQGEGEKLPGVDMVLSKPFTMASLRDAIARSLKT